MADTKKQLYIDNLQMALAAVSKGLEELEQLRDKYDALGYIDIAPVDLENSNLEGRNPQHWVDVWTTVNALQAIYNDPGHKGNIYRALP